MFLKKEKKSEPLRGTSVFLINIIYSDGRFSGRECLPMVCKDMDYLLFRAYDWYCQDISAMVINNSLESEKLTKEQFTEAMKRGFETGYDFVLIQGRESHIQYEPVRMDFK